MDVQTKFRILKLVLENFGFSDLINPHKRELGLVRYNPENNELESVAEGPLGGAEWTICQFPSGLIRAWGLRYIGQFETVDVGDAMPVVLQTADFSLNTTGLQPKTLLANGKVVYEAGNQSFDLAIIDVDGSEYLQYVNHEQDELFIWKSDAPLFLKDLASLITQACK